MKHKLSYSIWEVGEEKAASLLLLVEYKTS